MGLVNSVVWSGSEFVSVATSTIKENEPVGGYVVRYSDSGELRKATPLGKPHIAGAVSVSMFPQKIIHLPDGGYAVVGWVTAQFDRKASVDHGWVVHLDGKFNELWNEAFPSGGNWGERFHSSRFDPASGLLLAVGRRQLGPDRKLTCESWSQGLIATINLYKRARTGVLAVGKTDVEFKNRQGYFDVALSPSGKTAVAVGFASAPNPNKSRKCRDTARVSGLKLDNDNKWVAEGSYSLHDDAYLLRQIVNLGDRKFIAAGRGWQGPNFPYRGLAALVQHDPAVAPILGHYSYPEDNSDQTGNDRLGVVRQIPGTPHLVVAGSASKSREDTNKAWWQVIGSDLVAVSPPRVMQQFTRSQIRDLAVSDRGTILAVGRVHDGAWMAWAGVVHSGMKFDQLFDQLFGQRKPPDQSLPRLSRIRKRTGSGAIDFGALDDGALQFYGRDLRAGAQIEIAFSLKQGSFVRFIANATTGDLDLVLLDDNDNLVDFSDHGPKAAELVDAKLKPGQYVLAITAASRVRSFDLISETISDVEDDQLAQLQKLHSQARSQLGGLLTEHGYHGGQNIDIALGSQTLRSLWAMSYSAGKRPAASELREKILSMKFLGR